MTRIVHDLYSLDRDGVRRLCAGELILAVHSPAVMGKARLRAADPTWLKLLPGPVALGQEIGEDLRVAAIEALNNGRHLEIDVDLVSYRQGIEPGTHPNANGVRVRSDAFGQLAESSANTPFLNGHEWGDTNERGGTIFAASVDETDAELILRESAHLTRKWSVEAFLTGNLDRLSVGMVATEAWQCTVCQAPVTECWHYPLEQVDGQVVEWQAACRKVETSAVNVPAVTGTSVSPRLVARFAQGDDTQRKETIPVGSEKKATDEMAEFKARLAALEASNAELKSERDGLTKTLADERAERRAADADRWLAGLVENGRIGKDSTMAGHLRELFCSGKAGEATARGLAEDLKPGAHAPFSAPQRHRAKPNAEPTEVKRWELPVASDGRVDSAKLSADLGSWPVPLRDRVRQLQRTSSHHNNPVAILRGLFASGTGNQLLEQAGFERIDNWQEVLGWQH
ncbi:MAG: hypothetical protein AAGC55_01050 [Myxococcota bacterium]